MGLPVGFDRRGGYVTFDEDHTAVFTPVDTAHPVLHFTGANLDGSAIAYTSLARLKMGSPLNRELIDLEDSLALTLDDLVPTGELIIEKDGQIRQISAPGEMATFAAWSPADSSVIAYTYARDDSYGLAVVDVENAVRLMEETGDFAPDYLAWSDDGQYVGLYLNDESDVTNTGFTYAEEHEGFGEIPYHFQFFDIERGDPVFDIENMVGNGRIRLSDFDEGFEVELPYGRISSPHFMGGDEVVLERQEGEKIVSSTFKAEQIRHRSSKGIAFVNTDGQFMELLATDGSGDSEAVAPPATTVTYYIPMPSGSKVTFIQVGKSYSSFCSVSGSYTHTTSSRMGYAVDIQLSYDSSYDEIQASGTGTTYNSSDSVSCNYGDTSSCADRTSSCKNNFGNWVTLLHADGYYTLYGHMEYGSTTPTMSGAAAAAGCYLGDQGHTGYSIGDNYDTDYGTTQRCGDHLHFQKQTGGSATLSSSNTSVSVSFYEDSTLTSSDCGTKAKTPRKAGMSCSL